jgi:hypothetical protein
MYTMISVIISSNHDIYIHTRDITKEDQEQSNITSLANRSYNSYIRGVDYEGLNGNVTSAIFH